MTGSGLGLKACQAVHRPAALSCSVKTLSPLHAFPREMLGLPGWTCQPSCGEGKQGPCRAPTPCGQIWPHKQVWFHPLLDHFLKSAEGKGSFTLLTSYLKSPFSTCEQVLPLSESWMRGHPIPKVLLTPAGLLRSQNSGYWGKLGWGGWASPVVMPLLLLFSLCIVEPLEEMSNFWINIYWTKSTSFHVHGAKLEDVSPQHTWGTISRIFGASATLWGS